MKKLSLKFSLFALALHALPGMASELPHYKIPDFYNLQPLFYKLQPLEVNEVVPTAEELYSDFLLPEKQHPSLTAAIDWGTVVLVGEKIIQIIQAGKPVGDVKRDVVHVLPGGLNTWDQLSGWREPATKVYSVTAKNYLNMTVIDLRLKVSANYGGNLNGRGKYLANVVVVPTSIYVLWGFNCDVWTEHHDPVNTGTRENAIAGLGFDIRYRYGSALSEQIGTQDYFLSGTGEIKELQ